MARSPRAIARCVLPTPGGPRKVGDAVHPGVRLAIEVPPLRNSTAGQKLYFTYFTPLSTRPFGLRPVGLAQPRLEPQGEVEKRRVPVGHAGVVPPEDDDLRVVVETGARETAEALEGIHVTAHEARDVRAPDELDIQEP